METVTLKEFDLLVISVALVVSAQKIIFALDVGHISKEKTSAKNLIVYPISNVANDN
jgi:hypothetical protein